MACITRIRGIGVADCRTGQSNGTFYDLTYPGKWTLGSRPGCIGAAPIDPGGTPHPVHIFSSVESITYEDCTETIPDQPCDCLNGGCVPKTTYNTPGKYASIAACQAGCAKDSNCDGECIPTAEIAALQQAASTVKSRICK